MKPTPQDLIRILAVLCICLVPSCGGDPGTDPGNGGPDQNPDITLTPTSALPFAPVEVLGISPTAAGLHATVTTATGEQSLGYVERSPTGKLFVYAPLNSDSPLAGGDVEIRVTDGDKLNSMPVTLTVEALPPAPGAFSQVITTLQDYLSSWLAVHGTTRTDLRNADISNLDADLLAALVAHGVLDDPDNPNSLRAFADGPIALFDNAVVDYDLADRIVAHLGFQGFLEDGIATVDSLGGFTPRSLTHGLSPLANGYPQITTAAQLDHYMRIASEAEGMNSGAQGELIGDLAFAATLAALYPPATVVATGISVSLWAYQKVNEGTASLLPSKFTGQRCELTPEFFEEDNTGTGSWRYFVDASNTGWKLDRLVLEAVLQFVGARGGYGDWITGVLPPKATQSMGEFVATEVTNRTLALTPDSDVLEIEPHTWADIEVTGLPWSTGEISFGESVVITVETGYAPVNTGISTLRLQTGAGLFGNLTTFKTVDIEVREILVTIDPPVTTAETTEDVTLTATVDNAVDTSLEWTVHPPGILVNTLNNFTIVVRTPPQPWNPAILVEAASTAANGLRGLPEAPVRKGEAIITNQPVSVNITTEATCLMPDETKAFTADVIGESDQSVTWTASAGSFAGNLYTAPSTPMRDIVITATSTLHPEASESISVIVSSCTCWWTASTGSTGDFAVFLDSVVGLMFSLHPASAIPNPPYFNFQGTTPIAAGVTGTFPVILTYTSPSRIWVPIEDPLPQLTITESTADYIEGFVSGRLMFIVDPIEPQIDYLDVRLNFRAAKGDGSPFPCDPE